MATTEPNQEPLYLVDGSGYIFRAFYAIAPLSNPNGLPTNALFGFTRMLAKLIKDVKAHYLAVTFDTKEPTFRHELYAEYKANRAECPAELVPQMPYFRSITKALGIACLEKPGVEADDIIATLATRMSALGHQVVIVSGDKDLLQLVNGQVTVLDAMRDTTFTPPAVKDKFGVGPEQILDYLSLIGDASDNVPGVKGIGPKTAERLLQEFGSLAEVLKDPSKIEGVSGLRGAKGIREKIESGGDALRLSQQLIALNTAVEPYDRIGSVEELAWHGLPQGGAADGLRTLFEELDFSSLLSSFGGSRPAAAEQSFASKKFTAISAAELEEFASHLRAQPKFAFDTETSSLDTLTCELYGISISWCKDEAFYLPVGGANASGHLIPLDEVRRVLGPIFGNAAQEKLGVNLKFDIGVLASAGIEVHGATFDAMIASHLLNPDGRQNGLKGLSERYLNERMVSYEELVGDHAELAAVPFERLVQYACHDADASFALEAPLAALLGDRSGESPSLRRVFDEVEMPLVPVLSQIERAGIKVDVPFLEELGARFADELAGFERSIWELAGREFNINSPKQLGAILFDEMQIPTKGVKKTTHGYSTDASVLSNLAPAHPIAARLLEYREVHKLHSTYVEALRRLVHPRTGRIHTSFNQTVTATGRLSSTEPNLQNIPIRNPRGRLIRRAFIAEPGCTLISVDYSQIELRILAHLSGDKNLRDAFVRGDDIHRRTAEEMFGTLASSPEEMKDLRRVAKTINFGIIYGMGAFRLANELGISRKQAQQYIDNYFGRYPSVQLYFDSLKKDIERRGYVETLFGRRRHQQEVDTSGRDAGYAERSLLNAPIQGSAAEVMKVAMIHLSEQLKPFASTAAMVLQVHDELVFEVRDEQCEEIRELVVRTMESAVPLTVPLRVDVHSGKSWGEDVW